MLIKDQLVETTWNPTTKKYYMEKGYKYTKIGDSFLVKLEDLPLNSHSKINIICDFCGDKFQKTYKDYQNQHENGDCCKSCSGIKSLYVGEKNHGKNCRGKKLKEISMERYGVDNVAKLSQIQEKIAKTNLQKYGVKSVLCKEYKERVQPYSWGEKSREKREKTNMIKYGYKSSLSSPEIREKINMSYYKNNSQKVSKPQLEIYNMLKGVYEKCELNYPCGRCSLDCMIVVNGIKIDVEYDAPYWHKDKEKDRRRDEFIKSCGYKILRIKGNTTIPTLKDIVDKIDILINTDKKYEKIQLV